MRKFWELEFIFLLTFLPAFFSCKPNSEGGSEQELEQELKQELPSGFDKNCAYLKINNKTPSKLEIYSDPARSELVETVETGSNKILSFSSENEVVFYLTYYINLGVEIPFSDVYSTIVQTPKIGKIQECNVPYPAEFSTSSAFIILKNNSTSNAIQLRRGSIVELPVGMKSDLVAQSETAVYEIKKSSFVNYDSFFVRDLGKDATCSLPAEISSFASGQIYTLSFNDKAGEGAELQLASVTHFSPDAKNKIWSMASGNFRTDVLRSRRDASKGSIVAGSYGAGANLQPQVLLIDQYGKQTAKKNIDISSGGTKASGVQFLDILESESGEFIMLLAANFSEGVGYYIMCWDGALASVKWSGQIPVDTENDFLLFSPNTKGSLIELGANTFAVCGARRGFSGDEISGCRYFCAKIFYDGTNISFSEYSGSSPAGEGYEQIFTSMWHDKTGARIIAVGYENFNGNYSPPAHKGVVYSFNEDLSSHTVLYSQNKCLFYGVDGDASSGKFYVCGEGCDAGNAPKGCFVSSEMIAKNAAPILFSNTKQYGWFTQICREENRVVLSGQAASATDGTGENAPWILAVNKQGGKIWENFFGEYDAVYTCMKNGIGSFLVELYKTSNGDSKIISTDLLGQDTGTNLGYFPK